MEQGEKSYLSIAMEDQGWEDGSSPNPKRDYGSSGGAHSSEKLDQPWSDEDRGCWHKFQQTHPSSAKWLEVAGPGIVVMLADTDVGSLITAAQSGTQWGYYTLGLQLLLIPILYVTQSLTVTLGVVTGKGHGELLSLIHI
eukprot:TRINITY_DN8561_c0_g1_i3.p2 TRINITY_DN8561_c0_g1~~TRINITY_DN8561_c0_g1_i3.p2  ORF type:complete len:140 (-),score=32.58 TRINITY_DN8561_c0_g1_i3:131-550(-)